VTRTRWIATRLALVVLATAVLMGLLSTAVTWWQRPFDLANSALYINFAQRDLVPVAYAVFAVALGALLGAIVRRTLVAMAATIVGYVGSLYLAASYVRPAIFEPLRSITPFRIQVLIGGVQTTIGPPQANDWVNSDEIVTTTGRVVGQHGGIGPNGSIGFNVNNDGTAIFNGVGRCPNRVPVPPGGIRAPNPTHAQAQATQVALQHCVDSFHLREVVTFQPASRYWPLQWTEATIFVGLAFALGAVCVWWVRRRLP
jgi:hypothetical protein